MSVLLEFSMSPVDKGESISPYIARSLDIIDKSGLPYQLNAMGTVVEGNWDEVNGVVKKCFEEMKKDCRRISVSMKIDYRVEKENRLEGKIKSVEEKVGRKLRT